MNNSMPSRQSVMMGQNQSNVPEGIDPRTNFLSKLKEGKSFTDSLPTTQNVDQSKNTPDSNIKSEPKKEPNKDINVIRDYDWTYSKNKNRKLDEIPYIKIKEFKMMGNTYISSLMTTALLFPDIVESNVGQNSFFEKIGYNVNQAKIAIGSGGFFGKGYLQGTQTKYDFVPEQDTDFIFCTVGEEWGFLGSSFVIIMQLVLMIRLVFMSERQRSPFSRIYGYGVASVLFFHMAVNVGMTIGLAPVIGIPLPFFSYGGSSLWSFTILLFIFIKLDSHRLQILR